MAINPNDVSSTSNESFSGNQSFDQILEGAFKEVSGTNQPPDNTSKEVPTPKTKPKELEKKQTSTEAVEEVEYEGKKYKVEKSAKDYLKDMMDAKKGMRKFQAERDKERQSAKERERDLQRYNQILSVWKNKGIEGLYDDLAGKEGAYTEMLKKHEERAVKKYNATEDELRYLQQEELIERERNLREMAEKAAKETLEVIQRKEEAAQTEMLSAKLNEAFASVSFEGKLGDEKREDKFNKYVWEQARMALKDYAEERKLGHHEIPTRVIRSAFAEAAADLHTSVTKQIAEDLVRQTQKTSEAATLAAQARSTSDIPKGDNSLEGLADKHKNPHDFINALFERR